MSAIIYQFPCKKLQTLEEFVELLMNTRNYMLLSDHEQLGVCLASQVIACNFHDSMIRYDFVYLLRTIAVRHKFIRD